MTETPFSIDDPRLTAYVLGELDESQQRQVEAWLADNPAGQAHVAELRSLTARIFTALQLPPATVGVVTGNPRMEKATEGLLPSRSPALSRSRTSLLLMAGICLSALVAVTLALVLPGSSDQNQSRILAMNDRTAELQMMAPNSARPQLETRNLAEQEQFGVLATPVQAIPDPGTSQFHFYDSPTNSRETLHEGLTPRPVVQGESLPAHRASGSTASPPVQAETRMGRLPSLEKSPALPSIRSTEMEASGQNPTDSASITPRIVGLKFTQTGQQMQPENRFLQRGLTPPNASLDLVENARAGFHFKGNDTEPRRLANVQRRARGRWDGQNAAPFDLVPNSEAYAPMVENDFLTAANHPLSTFGLDVDTGSFSNVRRFLLAGHLPPPNAIRIEEFINSFQYGDPAPEGNHPLAISVESAPCPWNDSHKLLRIGFRAKEIPRENRPPTSLVFLIDSSGSMSDANKLPLVQASLRLLVQEMEEQDRIAIVTYADEARIILDSTTADHHDRILEAIDSLTANGSTNGAGGLAAAYHVATEHLIPNGANRVLLCTDGDFNVGISDNSGVFELIEKHRKSGVFLSVLGFGTGNLKDDKLEGIANRGNGHYAYIDRLKEARRVLVEQLTGTLYTVAKDVKLQVEFNPQRVRSYRLLGYENRILAAEDFQNDNVDAGEIGAGHAVSALYEVEPTTPGTAVPKLRYGTAAETESTPSPRAGEDLFIKLRYKLPEQSESRLLEVPVKLSSEKASPSLQWAACVAEFGLLLRNSTFKGTADWSQLLAMTRAALENASDEHRVEFLDLVLRAKALKSPALSKEPLQELGAVQGREKARCGGRYSDLLDKFTRPEDGRIYGGFHDFGFRRGTGWGDGQEHPDGYCVYIYPDWYIWKQGQPAAAR
jgi:Ca-activated chloride channel family protein